MGSAACHELARRGQRVLGVEQFSLVHTRGSSHGQTRIIRTAYAEHPSYVPLVRRAFEKWYELEQFTGRHLLTECACLNAGPPASEHVEGVRASVREHALAAEELSAESINRRFKPFQLPGDYSGVLEQAAGFLLVEDCVRAQIDAAVALGADIRANEPVRQWRVIGDSVEVATDKDTYRASKLVIAAGAWATQLLAETGVPLRVMRQTLLWFDVGSRAGDFRRDRFPIFIIDAPGQPFYGLPALDRFGLKVARHYGAPELANPEGVNWNINDEDLTTTRPLIDNYLPVLGSLTKGQVCMYTVTPDRHFVIDLHPRWPNVAIACGFSGHGFKFAPTVGEVLADLVERGASSHDIQLFSANRFSQGTS